MGTTEQDPLLTAEELAAKLGGVKKSTILTWRQQGLITAEIRSGRILRFSEARVRQQLREAAAKTGG